MRIVAQVFANIFLLLFVGTMQFRLGEGDGGDLVLQLTREDVATINE